MERKSIAIILALILILTVGCSKTDESKDNVAGSSVATQSGEEAQVTELSVHMHDDDGYTIFDSSLPVWKIAEEANNIVLKGTAPTTPLNSEEVFNLMLAADEIPDIIHTKRANVLKYNEKLFLPLDELIEEHAPDLKALLEERQDVVKHMKAADGKMYYIPFIPDGEASMGWHIRKDWLDQLGLEVPSTYEDMLTVMKAFKDNDLNGNGINDEVPFFSRRTLGIYDLLGIYGLVDVEYVEEGMVKNDLYSQDYKEGIIGLRNLYKEGLIDAEIFTRGNTARDMMFDDNIGGMTLDWFGSTAGYQDKYVDQIEGLDWIPMAPPADINGDVWIEYSRKTVEDMGWGISINNEHPEETIKFMNYWFTEEGRRLMNYGIEGQTYDMVDGKAIFNEKTLSEGKSVLENMRLIGAQTMIGFHQDFEYEKQWMNELALEGAQMYIDNDYFIDLLPALNYTDEEQKRIAKIEPQVKAYVEEMSQKWILDAVSVEDTFDDYMKKLEELGAVEMMQIKQAAYERYQNN